MWQYIKEKMKSETVWEWTDWNYRRQEEDLVFDFRFLCEDRYIILYENLMWGRVGVCNRHTAVYYTHIYHNWKKYYLCLQRWASGRMFPKKKKSRKVWCFHWLERCKDQAFCVSRSASNMYCEHLSKLSVPPAASATETADTRGLSLRHMTEEKKERKTLDKQCWRLSVTHVFLHQPFTDFILHLLFFVRYFDSFMCQLNMSLVAVQRSSAPTFSSGGGVAADILWHTTCPILDAVKIQILS